MSSPLTKRLKAAAPRPDADHGEDVLTRLCEVINHGGLRAGDRLPPERDLARRLGVSRPTLRVGIGSLVSLGILYSRRGSGTFVLGTPAGGGNPLRLLTSLHGLDPGELFEVRLALEMAGAGLAAERATGEQVADMAEEVAEMYASLDDPAKFLAHDASFRRLVVTASGNRVLVGLINMLGPVAFDLQSETGGRAQVLKEWAGTHREIYRAIRYRNQASARAAVQEYWLRARAAELVRI